MWKRLTRNRELTCQWVRVQLLPYFDGQLSFTRKQAMREHLATCRACAQYAREARELEAGLFAGAAHHIQGLRLSPQAAARIQERIYRRMRRAVIVQRVTHYTGKAVGLVAILALAVGLFALSQWGPSGPETGPEKMTSVQEPSLIPPATFGELGYAPTFEPAKCQFGRPYDHEVECGYLTVPENRSQPGGPTIRLHVAIFESTSPNPAPDPVIHLVGGPGGSLLHNVSFYLDAGGDEILATRDYIMFNQRGTHYAIPSLNCPGYSDFKWGLEGQDLDPEERKAREIEYLLHCQDNLLNQGIDLTAYNSAENAADVNDLRVALGYDQVNLYGISYGSRLALTVMRDYPEGVRSAIIDSVYPPQVGLYSEMPVNVTQAFHTLFQDCAADPRCSQIYPDLRTTFYRVIDELDANPAQVALGHGTITVDGDYFMYLMLTSLWQADAVPRIPAMISGADRGDFDALSHAFGGSFACDVSEGMQYSLQCREEVPFESIEGARALARDVPSQVRNYFAPIEFDLCESWESGVADPIENEPVVSDVPTLVLVGRYDPVTPPAWGRLAVETLSNSFFYEFPGVGHGVMRSNECALEIGLQFLDDPTTEPHALCMDQLTGTDFK